MKKLICAFLFAFAVPLNLAIAAENPQVVVSIKPIHSLVSAIMQGVATPQLIVKKGSPHGYSLRPSEAQALAHADLVIWVGPELESFLAKPLETLAQNAQKLQLAQQLKSSLLSKRDGGNWESASHHEEHSEEIHTDHEEHADLAHSAHENHEEETHGAHQHPGSVDLHIWLDPKMALKIVAASSKMLIQIDPAHAQQYLSNTAKLKLKLSQLDQQLKEQLAPVQHIPYLVFHSAYQYFETAYQLNSVGSVTIDPDRKPGAKGLTAIRQKVQSLNARCVFSEPQFASSLVKTIIEDSGAKTASLDPLGANIPAGPDAYFILMNHLANDLIAGLL